MNAVSIVVALLLAPAPTDISNAVIVAPLVVTKPVQEPFIGHTGNGGTMWAFK